MDQLPPKCRDCGRLYSSIGLDFVLPRSQWLLIHPEDGGVLCASCMIERAAKLPGVINVVGMITFSANYEDGQPDPYRAVTAFAERAGRVD